MIKVNGWNNIDLIVVFLEWGMVIKKDVCFDNLVYIFMIFDVLLYFNIWRMILIVFCNIVLIFFFGNKVIKKEEMDNWILLF